MTFRRRLTSKQRERQGAVKREPLRIRLTLDNGLAAYVRAYAKGVGLYGGTRETIIALIREGMTERTKSEVFLKMMLPHLPDDIRRAWGDRP